MTRDGGPPRCRWPPPRQAVAVDQRDGQAQDIAKALAITERVIAADPSLAEGWFNRASAFEQMFMFDEARRAWQEYLRLDSNSGWAAEARRHLEQLARKRS